MCNSHVTNLLIDHPSIVLKIVKTNIPDTNSILFTAFARIS